MFVDWLKFLSDDIRGLIYSFTLKDLEYPSYFILWLAIVFCPLVGIDRHDPIAGLVYILYLVAAGATLFFALPGNFDAFGDFFINFSVLLLMGCIAAYRWFHGNNKRKVVAKKDEPL